MVPGEIGNRLRDQRREKGRDHADLEQPALERLQRLQGRDAAVELAKRAGCVSAEGPAGLGEPDAPADPVEQRHAELVLELADAVRQG